MRKLSSFFLLSFSLITTLFATYEPPSCGYDSQDRATKVYYEAFDRAVEFVKMNQIEGDIVEFGTLEGFTASIFAKLIAQYKMNSSLHLFDSFEGFPEITSKVDLNSYEVKDYKVWQSGGMALNANIPELIKSKLQTIIPLELVHIHKGYFSETFKEGTLQSKPSIVHVDCDLYQSAKEVLSNLFKYDLVQDGMIILFDDYNCGRANPKFGERRALKEVMDENPNFSHSLFFYYGWHGAAFIIHKEDKEG
ncbi:MAG: class I SAM-dependent methyltransferase [Chlamydiales bacterium]|nr:class I SAM-dependent methyltransferase [Chlamydiia bacterium]MCP5503955.1 class I SAM-dependent methyltransferase [Chlamydiales bacterium]